MLLFFTGKKKDKGSRATKKSKLDKEKDKEEKENPEKHEEAAEDRISRPPSRVPKFPNDNSLIGLDDNNDGSHQCVHLELINQDKVNGGSTVTSQKNSRLSKSSHLPREMALSSLSMFENVLHQTAMKALDRIHARNGEKDVIKVGKDHRSRINKELKAVIPRKLKPLNVPNKKS